MDHQDLSQQTFEDLLLKALAKDMETCDARTEELNDIEFAIIPRCVDQDRNQFLDSCCRLNGLLDINLQERGTRGMTEREQKHLVRVLQLVYGTFLAIYHTPTIACTSSSDPNVPIPNNVLLLQWMNHLVAKALLLTSVQLSEDLVALGSQIKKSLDDEAAWDQYLKELLLVGNSEAVPETPPVEQAEPETPSAESSTAPSPVAQPNVDAKVDCQPFTSSVAKKSSSILANRTRRRTPTRTQSMPLLPSSLSSTRDMNALGSLAEVEGEDDDG